MMNNITLLVEYVEMHNASVYKNLNVSAVYTNVYNCAVNFVVECVHCQFHVVSLISCAWLMCQSKHSFDGMN